VDSSERVLTCVSNAPGDIRRDLLRDLRAAVDADAAAFVTIAPDQDGTRRYVHGATVGGADFARGWHALEGHPALEGSFANNSEVTRAMRGGWTLESAPKRSRNRFCQFNIDYTDREAYLQSSLHNLLYQPLEIVDQLRALFFHRRRFIGWVGTLRMGRGHFTHADRRRLNAMAPRVEDALLAAECALPALGNSPTHALLTADGKVAGAAGESVNWLTRERSQVLGRIVRDVDAGSGPAQALVDSATVRIVRLDGTEGVRYLAILQPGDRIQLDVFADLTPTEKRVARDAALGLRDREIADDRGISLYTVKGHLRRVYDKLGVASRVELAHLFTSGG
jgi:DNA-binding CsgD family transcriptional regulator